jgi:hypothetical protein
MFASEVPNEEHGDEDHEAQRERIPKHPIHFRHVSKVHAVDTGDQSGHYQDRANAGKTFCEDIQAGCNACLVEVDDSL